MPKFRLQWRELVAKDPSATIFGVEVEDFDCKPATFSVCYKVCTQWGSIELDYSIALDYSMHTLQLHWCRATRSTKHGESRAFTSALVLGQRGYSSPPSYTLYVCGCYSTYTTSKHSQYIGLQYIG